MAAVKSILVPVDFSACSRTAVEHALFFAERFGARVHLLHAWDIPGYLRPDLTVWTGDVTASLADHARKEAEQGMQKFMTECDLSGRANVTSEVISGTPHATIVEAADQLPFDLIVMGTHGRTGLSHLFLGSVAEGVVRHAKCPVMTIPRPKEAPKG